MTLEAPPQTDEVSATEVGQLYMELFHRLRRVVDEAMNASGLSMSRAKLLGQLSEHGTMNHSELAHRLGFAPRSVTDTVDGLERDGLAVRSRDPNDRRAWLVEVTPSGTKALRKAMAAKRKAMEQIFGAMPAPARAQFAALLASISASLAPSSGETCAQ